MSQYDVPLDVLRIPARYYRRPPAYLRAWQRDDAPRWGGHWGRDWEQRRNGWNRWDRRSNRSVAPLPRYPSQYRGDRYPRQDQRQTIHEQQYRYQPREPVVRDYYRQQWSGATSPHESAVSVVCVTSVVSAMSAVNVMTAASVGERNDRSERR